MAQSFRFRRGTAAEWTSANPVLALGEPGYATDTNEYKIGDGTTEWDDLPLAAVAEDALAGIYFPNDGPTAHAPALGLYFPEAEGAVGNGTTSDTTAINAAITAAGTAGKGTVVLDPTKIYALGAQLSMASNVTLSGGTLRMTAAATSRAILVQNVTNVTIRDLTIDLNKAATSDGGNTLQQMGIYLPSSSGSVTDVVISNVTVKNSHQRGIVLAASGSGTLKRITITGCYLTNIDDRGISVTGGNPTNNEMLRIDANRLDTIGTGGIVVAGFQRVQITRNTLDMTGSNNHGITVSATGTTQHVTDFQVSDNYIEGATTTSRWGIVATVNSTRFIISRNIIDGCDGGITVDPEDGGALGTEVNVSATVSGNVVRNSSGSHGINARMLNRLNIIGNVCVGNVGSGIAVSSASDVLVDGNVTYGNGVHGIAFFGTGSGGNHTLGTNHSRSNNTLGGSGVDVFNAGTPNPVRTRLGHSGGQVGFYGATPVALQTGVAVSAAGIHAALVNLGLITA